MTTGGINKVGRDPSQLRPYSEHRKFLSLRLRDQITHVRMIVNYSGVDWVTSMALYVMDDPVAKT